MLLLHVLALPVRAQPNPLVHLLLSILLPVADLPQVAVVSPHSLLSVVVVLETQAVALAQLQLHLAVPVRAVAQLVADLPQVAWLHPMSALAAEAVLVLKTVAGAMASSKVTRTMVLVASHQSPLVKT